MAEKWIAFNAIIDNSFTVIGLVAILLTVVGGWLTYKISKTVIKTMLAGAGFLLAFVTIAALVKNV